MKKLLLVFLFLCWFSGIRAQQTSLDLDFSDPAHANRFTAIGDPGGEFIKTVENGEMKIEVNKTEWHFFQIWVQPFDFISNPYLSFRIKTDKETPVRIWIKQQNSTNEKVLYERTIAASSEYQTVSLSFDDVSPITDHIQEVGMDIGGYQVPPNVFSATVYFDEFKLGAASRPNTSLNLDFSDPAHADRFVPIIDPGGEFVKTVENGEMKLEINKTEWHFLQVYVKPFDFISNPYLSFRIKTDVATPIRIWVKQQNSENEKELLNQTIAPGSDYQTIQVSLESTAPLSDYIAEIGMDIGGYQVPPNVFSATVYLDDFKLGEAAKPAIPVFGTSYQEDFSDELFAGWNSRDAYALSHTDNALKVSVNRSVPVPDAELDKLPSLDFEGHVLDISANPYLNVNLKGDQPFTFSVIAIDNSRNRKAYKARVVTTGDYQTISLDLSSQTGIDLSRIERFAFDFNRDGFALNATIFMDDLRIGGGAANLATMDGIAGKKYYKNSGTREILLTNIENASAIELVNIPDLIENATVSAIANGKATLRFTLKEGQTGQGEVALQLKGAEGYSNHAYTFGLEVEDNLTPTINPVNNIEAESKKTVSIRLTGISDGNTTVNQKLAFAVSSSDMKVATGKVVYSGDGPYATLQLNLLKKGEAHITVTVQDEGDGNNRQSISFTASVFNKLNNPPTMDVVQDMEVYQDAGLSTIMLTGISDGDKGNQKLSFFTSSSDTSVVKNVFVHYSSGNQAELRYEPVALGKSTITISLTDNGGNGSNNGNVSTTMTFAIEVVQRPNTGYVATLEKSVEGYTGAGSYTITEEGSGANKMLVVQATDKFYWDGFSLILPEELDLSKHPYLTMEVYPVDQATLHWIWLYDASGVRNDLNNRAGNHIQRTVPNQWNKLVFDFSGENDWVNNGLNGPINNRRITRILFDMHNADFAWPPPPNYTGTFRIRNIRIGSEADFRPATVVAVNSVPNQVAFTNQSAAQISLTGLSNGQGGTSGLTFSIANSNPAVVMNPAIGPVDANGNATLTYQTGDVTGQSTLTITVSAAGSEDAQVSFTVDVRNASADEAATITIDLQQRHQTMYGFGTFYNNPAYTDMYTDLMGGSAMRIGMIGNQLEPVNDNDDPYVLNRKALNYNVFDWNYLRALKTKGVSSFILTSWSPPAWMKTNLSIDHYQAGYTLNTNGTTNRLDYHMYEEFAESMVAAVLVIKEETGIDLLAIGLQNEPAFHEPYPSAILGPDEFVELIKVVGRRFKREGIKTRLFMPEHVSSAFFVPDNMSYLNKLKADPEANEYCDIFAIHGYDSDGITPGQPDFSQWESYRDTAAPKDVWMTETYVEYRSFADALTIAGAMNGALEYGNVSLWTQWSFEGQMVAQGRPTPMLYAMSNYARFIRPGAVRVETNSGNEDVLATSFLDTNTGRLSVVMVNKGNTPISVKLKGQGLATSWQMYNTAENRNLEQVSSEQNGVFLLPARSITTLVGTATLNMHTIANVQVEVGTQTHTVLLQGIQNSQGGTQGLRLSLINSNTEVVPHITASTISVDGIAELTFSADKLTGTSSITVMLSDELGEKLTRTFRINVVKPGGREGMASDIRVHPNPSRGVFEIEANEEVHSIQVLDITGRQVFTTRLLGGRRTIHTAGLRPGVYILVAQTPNGSRTTRLVIE